MITQKLLEIQEKERIVDGFSDREVVINKKNINELNLLLQNQYQIEKINIETYVLRKEFSNTKSFRISLTEKCNYKCFFCHEEGLDMKVGWQHKQLDEIYNLCKRALRNDYNDITFTGGEPLIKYKEIIEILRRFEKDELRPNLTIVSNAQLLNDELIEAIKSYKGRVKFNISVHHSDSKKYLEITKPNRIDENHFEVIKNNIRKLTQNGIYTKLNFVVLKGINTSITELNNIITLSKELKVNRIKFLELLITDKLIDLYKYHYTLEAVITSLKDKLIPISNSVRNQIFKIKNTELEVEFSKVPCSLGCDKCILSSELILTSELKFHSCFFHSNKGLDVSNDEVFNKSVKEGLKHRLDYGRKFVNKTPFVVNERESLSFKKEYQYMTSENGVFVEQLKQLDFKFIRYREFNEVHYKAQKDNVFVKRYKNSYENKFYEVIKEVNIEGNVVETNFISPYKNMIEDIRKYDMKNEILGIEKAFEIDWKIKTYKNENKYISIGVNNKMTKSFILATFNIEKDVFDIEELNLPIEQYLFNVI